MSVSRQELMIHAIAHLLRPCRSVAVGAASPIPGAGALLARDWASREAPPRRVSVIGLGCAVKARSPCGKFHAPWQRFCLFGGRRYCLPRTRRHQIDQSQIPAPFAWESSRSW